MNDNLAQQWPNLFWFVLWSCFALMVALVWASVSIAQYRLANAELANALYQECYSQAVGEIVSLALVDGEIVCLKRYDGMHKQLWRRAEGKKS